MQVQCHKKLSSFDLRVDDDQSSNESFENRKSIKGADDAEAQEEIFITGSSLREDDTQEW